jgi:chromosomal replication initiator protein
VGKIGAALQAITGHPVAVELVLAPRRRGRRWCVRPAAPRRHGGAAAASVTRTDAALPELPAEPAAEPAPPDPGHRLNPALTFATLVEGSANRMARAAAMHVAASPGQLYNPLFIYGGVGLGKTHLVHAIGNQLLAERPEAKVLYIHAEQFVSDVVKSYSSARRSDAFKQRYHSLDLLLIDACAVLRQQRPQHRWSFSTPSRRSPGRLEEPHA